jgi:hypothetical protein
MDCGPNLGMKQGRGPLCQIGTKHIGGMKRLLAGVVISLLLFGCNQSRRPLSGHYYLERYDEGGTSYYVTAPGSLGDGGGVFDGTVQEVGWNQDWILARVKRIYHGDPSGWYALNLKTNQISGPFQDTELKTNPNFDNIKSMKPAEVFSTKR